MRWGLAWSFDATIKFPVASSHSSSSNMFSYHRKLLCCSVVGSRCFTPRWDRNSLSLNIVLYDHYDHVQAHLCCQKSCKSALKASKPQMLEVPSKLQNHPDMPYNKEGLAAILLGLFEELQVRRRCRYKYFFVVQTYTSTSLGVM